MSAPLGEGGVEHWLELEEVYERWHPPVKTRFEDEVEKYWGRPWGAPTEIGRLRMILLHRPGEEINSINPPLEAWRYTYKPSLQEMFEDHERLAKVFKDEGVEVVLRKPEDNRPPRLVKSIYTRDASFSVNGGMVIGRMYDALRRGEERYTAQTYMELGCPIIHTINGTGILEGAGVTYLDETHVVITTGYRTNDEGARQAEMVLRTSGVEEVVTVHLYSGHEPIHMVDKRTCVWNRQLPWWFMEYMSDHLKMRLIDGRRSGARASVVLRPGRIVIAEDEKVRRHLEKEGLDVIEVKISSLVHPRNSGSIHCLTMPIIRDPEPKS